MASYGIISNCNVHIIHVKIDDINTRAKEMTTIISDNSWIKKLGAIEQASYEARAERTIEKLVNTILSKVTTTISSEFGEFMISSTAQSVLENEHNHTKVPLAEFLKEKDSGNPGFDFHTESDTKFIAFGEAKYNTNTTSHTIALNQIVRFIGLKKDTAELVDLQHFVSKQASDNALKKSRAYVAAFSIIGKNIPLLFKNAIQSDAVKVLLNYPELYLIGIEVDA